MTQQEMEQMVLQEGGWIERRRRSVNGRIVQEIQLRTLNKQNILLLDARNK